MLSKFLLVISFVVLALVAYASSPRTELTLPPQIQQWVDWAKQKMSALDSNKNADAAEIAVPGTPAGDANIDIGAQAKADAGKDAVPLEQLLISVPPPEQASYALQAGLFGAEDQAAKLIERLVAMKLPKVQSIAAVDQQGQGWYVVAVGEYVDVGAAETAGIGLANQLSSGVVLPVIQLSPPAK